MNRMEETIWAMTFAINFDKLRPISTNADIAVCDAKKKADRAVLALMRYELLSDEEKQKVDER